MIFRDEHFFEINLKPEDITRSKWKIKQIRYIKINFHDTPEEYKEFIKVIRKIENFFGTNDSGYESSDEELNKSTRNFIGQAAYASYCNDDNFTSDSDEAI